MPRPRKLRRIRRLPEFVYFKPRAVPVSELEEVILSVDELEALRLKDIEKLDQTEAAEHMKIHQSTFQRTLAKAREKVTSAIIKGKAINIQGGSFKMQERRGFGPPSKCVCPNCGSEQPKQPGVPCATISCSKCKTRMMRG